MDYFDKTKYNSQLWAKIGRTGEWETKNGQKEAQLESCIGDTNGKENLNWARNFGLKFSETASTTMTIMTTTTTTTTKTRIATDFIDVRRIPTIPNCVCVWKSF